MFHILTASRVKLTHNLEFRQNGTQFRIIKISREKHKKLRGEERPTEKTFKVFWQLRKRLTSYKLPRTD